MRDHSSTTRRTIVAVAALLVVAVPAAAGEDVVIDALVDEMDRSMTLQLEDLEQPYFVQYTVNETEARRLTATCGAVVSDDTNRARRLHADVRVGYYDLDNSNFGGGMRGGRRGGRGGGGRMRATGITPLPVDDSYDAIRQATWLATDRAYKAAVETLARKRAYLEDRNMPERPADFSRTEPVESVAPKVTLGIDSAVWADHLRRISVRFLEHEQVQDSNVSLVAVSETMYLVNSEGTRIRRPDTTVALTVSAAVQAGDGGRLADRLSYTAPTLEGLPDVGQIIVDVDALASRLVRQIEASVLEHYAGPVLFDDAAAPQVFQALLSRGVAGRPAPIGGGRRRGVGATSLETYVGKRILPRSFQVHDDPRVAVFGDEYLAGHYEIDDEGVAAERVDIVVDGRLEGLVMSRVPTETLSGSNGHGRRNALGRAQAAAACLFVETGDATPNADLRQALIDAVLDQDLEFGIRVTSLGGAARAETPAARFARLQGGGGGAGSAVGDPVLVFKVYPDGREEPVRGCEFGSIGVGEMKDILAAGDTPAVYNAGATSVIAPPVLFEEVELFAIEDENERRPVLAPPAHRE